MTSRVVFEDFGSAAAIGGMVQDPTIVSDTSLEEHRVEAFEQGYKAGWDDAAAAQSGDQERISADFARNLQELTFTYAEVKAKMMEAMEPLLKELVESVLPQIAADNFGAYLVEELRRAVDGQTDVPVDLVLAPSNRAALEAILPDDLGLPVRVVEESTLGEGQVFLRVGRTERQIDMMDVLDRASGAVNGFFEVSEKVAVNE